MPVSPVPQGYHTATPYLILNDSNAAIDFYKKAFGAVETFRMNGPDGKSVTHAEIKIGDSMIMLGDESPMSGGKSPKTTGTTTAGVMLYVTDVDRVFNQARAAGATVRTEPTDMFWGDRMANVVDPFGHYWSIGTHKEDVAPEVMEQRAKEFYAKMGRKAAG